MATMQGEETEEVETPEVTEEVEMEVEEPPPAIQ
jgi:hypothetical protein